MEFSYTILLVIITVLVSFYAHERPSLKERLLFRPYEIKRNPGEAYRFVTHAFVHADLIHLAFNMMVLYMFGSLLEKYFIGLYGSKGLYYYVLLYFGGAIFSSIYSFVRHKDNILYGSLGASGATSALVFSYVALFPTHTLKFLFLPIPMPAIIFGILILAIEYYLDKRGNTNIAHDAHIFGSLYGFGFTILLDRDIWHNFIYQLQHGF